MTHSIWKSALKAALALTAGMSLVACTEDNSGDPRPEKTTSTTISDVLASEKGEEFTVECVTVVAANQQGVILQENDACIYAFLGESHNLIPGDMVTVSGTLDSRNGLLQFGGGCQLTKTWHDPKFSQPEPVNFTGADVNEYMSAPAIRYITLTGLLKVSGNYSNLEIEGTDNIGSLDYMSDDFKSTYNGHTLTISGWAFGSYKTYMYIVPVEVEDNGEWEETVPEGAIYFNSFDKELAVQDADKYETAKGWPFTEQFDGWKNEKGSGVENVSYDCGSISIRTNQSSKGSLSLYSGSGNNNLLFSTAPNHFTIQKISVPSQNLRLTFGAQRYAQGGANAFIKSDFEVKLSADGEAWSPAIDYDFGGVEDKAGDWRLAIADFTLPAGTNTLYIKFSAKVSSTNRIDDVLLVEGNGGQQIEFGKEVETPVSSISDILSKDVDNVYKAEGQVICTHSKGFLLKDDTGTILVFTKKDLGLSIGDNVTVEGATTLYGGLKQFGETSVVTKTGTGSYSHPSAKEYKASDFNAFAKAPAIQYVTYTGKMHYYKDSIYQPHYDVILDGTDIVGTISYPANTWNAVTFDGRDVIVTGYAIGYSENSYGKSVNTMITNIERADKETMPDESTALTVKALNEKLKSLESGASLKDLVAFKGYVAANDDCGALYQMVSIVDNTGEAYSGIILKGEEFNEKTLPVGTKVIVSLKDATYDLYNGLPQIKTTTIFKTEEKVSIKVPDINDDECAKYLGQYVNMKNLTAPASATTWVVNNKTTSTTFTGAKGGEVTARITKYASYKDLKIAHKTADLKGIITVFNGDYQIIPTSNDDVAGFTE